MVIIVNRVKIPDWIRTRKFAIGASILVHAGVFAFLVFDEPRHPRQEVVIEFVPLEKPLVAPAAKREVEKTAGVAQVEPGDPGETSKLNKPQPAARQAAALQAILAMDLSALRSNVVRTGLEVDGLRIQTAWFALIEPTIHLTEGEVDSLVSEGHGYAKQGRKRGIQGRQSGPPGCFPPLR